MSHKTIKDRAIERDTKVYPEGNDPKPTEYFGTGSYNTEHEQLREEIRKQIRELFDSYFLKITFRDFDTQLMSMGKIAKINPREFEDLINDQREHIIALGHVRNSQFKKQKTSQFIRKIFEGRDYSYLIMLFYAEKEEMEKMNRK
jgi:hypothetical protein